MITVKGYAAKNAKALLEPFVFKRRNPRAHDVLINIEYCGVCHSDIHQARNEWGGAVFPMVPGHEIVGRVSAVGEQVKNFKVGDTVGVGCMVGSCQHCDSCHNGTEQYCEQQVIWTYNTQEPGATEPNYGGYSSQIVVNEKFVLHIAPNLPLDKVAPLLCAGITTYSPLRTWKVSKGQRVGIIGLGGLGHMAVKLAAAMGAEVTVFSTSDKKRADALHFGAKNYVNTSNANAFESVVGKFDLIIDTVSAAHSLDPYLNLLRVDGTIVLLGIPDKPEALQAMPLIAGRRRIAGSLIGGIAETQEMLDFCAKHGITSDVEVISINKINEAYERMLKSDVRYRFVIDLKSLG